MVLCYSIYWDYETWQNDKFEADKICIFLYSGGWNAKRYQDHKGRTQYYGRDTVSDEILQWIPESKTWEQIGTLKLRRSGGKVSLVKAEDVEKYCQSDSESRRGISCVASTEDYGLAKEASAFDGETLKVSLRLGSRWFSCFF